MAAVLITRPQLASECLAYQLQERGYEGVIEPLLVIRPTDVPPPELKDIQAVMMTSANAISGLKQGDYDYDALLGYTCFCVGPHTAEKAAQFGFRTTPHSDGDGADLAELVARTLPDRKKGILHIAGKHTDGNAQDRLHSLGFHVTKWPIYDAVPLQHLHSHTIQLLKQQKIDAVMVFSVRTAETLKALLKQHALEACCKDLIAIGLSTAVSSMLAPLHWRELATAAHPTEEAALECLMKILPVSRLL